MTKAHKTALTALEAQIADTIQHWTTARDGVQTSLEGILSFTRLTESQDHTARLVNVLLDGLGNGINGNAIREWCGLHMNMVLNKENKMSCKKFDIKKLATAAQAAKVKWWSLKVQKPVLFDLDAQIVALLKKAETNLEKAPEKMPEGSKVTASDAALKALRSIAKDAAARVEAAKAAEKVAA